MDLTESLFQNFLNALSLGAIYALIALGYTLVYGILRLINFAHGEIFMVGAYAGLYTALGIGAGNDPGILPFIIVMLAAMAVSGLLGVGIERFAYRPLRGSPRINLLITAVGVSLLLENLGQLNWGFKIFGADFFGPTPQVFPEILPQTALFTLAGVNVTNHIVVVVVTSLLLMLGLEYIIHKTRLGRAMRAVSHNHETASLMGIPTDRIISFTFLIGSMLAAAGAVLYGVMYPRGDPLMGILPGLKAFVAAVVGGIGNVRGAVVGSLIIGAVEVLATMVGLSTWRDAFVFGILIAFLVWKPTGLFGKYEPEKV